MGLNNFRVANENKSTKEDELIFCCNEEKDPERLVDISGYFYDDKYKNEYREIQLVLDINRFYFFKDSLPPHLKYTQNLNPKYETPVFMALLGVVAQIWI